MALSRKKERIDAESRANIHAAPLGVDLTIMMVDGIFLRLPPALGLCCLAALSHPTPRAISGDGLNGVPQNSDVRALNPSVMLFGDGVFGRSLGLMKS